MPRPIDRPGAKEVIAAFGPPPFGDIDPNLAAEAYAKCGGVEGAVAFLNALKNESDPETGAPVTSQPEFWASAQERAFITLAHMGGGRPPSSSPATSGLRAKLHAAIDAVLDEPTEATPEHPAPIPEGDGFGS